MKRNILLWALFLLLASPILFFTNCSDDPTMDAVPPSFQEVVVSPKTVHAGDPITFTIKSSSIGKSWYKVRFSWTLANYDLDPIYSVKGDTFSLGMKDPEIKIKVPKAAPAGHYYLTISSMIVDASSLFQNGSPFGSATLDNNRTTFTVVEEEEQEEELQKSPMKELL